VFKRRGKESACPEGMYSGEKEEESKSLQVLVEVVWRESPGEKKK